MSKSIWRSRTVYLALSLAVLGGVLEVLQGAEGVPAWVLSVLGVVVGGLRLVTRTPVVVWRGDDDPPSSVIGGTGIVLLILLLGSCAQTHTCTRARWVVEAHSSMPAPAGVVRLTCDGELLPVTVTAEDVEVPPCL